MPRLLKHVCRGRHLYKAAKLPSGDRVWKCHECGDRWVVSGEGSKLDIQRQKHATLIDDLEDVA